MKVSKMHYAVELASRGNKVFFVNPPRKWETNKFCTTQSLDDYKNIFLIHIREHPLRILLREKFFFLYKILERKYIRKIQRITGKIDEVWNFNPQFIIHGNLFRAKKNLLFMYDFFKVNSILKSAKNSDAIVSVAHNILDSFDEIDKPKFLLQHGLAKPFEQESLKNSIGDRIVEIVKIGYIGNLFHPEIDHGAFRKIIKDHSDIEFHIWGADKMSDNNLSTHDADREVKAFLEFMRIQKNVFLHGIKSSEFLAKEIQDMNGFLVLYNGRLDMNTSSNAHKIIEYLSTGKAVFSMFVSNYKNSDLLIQDANESNNFPEFFSREIKQLERHNNKDQQRKRIAFALENTYEKQVDKIFYLSKCL